MVWCFPHRGNVSFDLLVAISSLVPLEATMALFRLAVGDATASLDPN